MTFLWEVAGGGMAWRVICEKRGGEAMGCPEESALGLPAVLWLG